jgi:hypothetical protein
MEHVGQLDRIVTLYGDEVLHADVDGVADSDVVAAAVLAVGDARLLHPEHLADERAEHGRRAARRPGQDRPEPGGLTIGGLVVDEDAHPPVALAHHRRRVQEQGKAQAADVNAVDVARFDVVRQQRTAPVERGLCRQRRPDARAHRVTRARFEVFAVQPPGHSASQVAPVLP